MKLETQKNIGQNLRILRLSKGLSQSQLADITGISRNLYAAYELGNRTPDAEFLYDVLITATLFRNGAAFLFSKKQNMEVYNSSGREK